MSYEIWIMKLLSISGVIWFNGVTLAGLGLKNDHARFRLFDLYHFAAGFDHDGKPGAHATAQSREGVNLRRLELPAPPSYIDFKSAAGAQPFDAPVGPGRRRRGQQVNLSRVALQQHLGDARGAAEVAVDLERRVNVEQVGQRRFAEQREQVLIRLLSVFESRPE